MAKADFEFYRIDGLEGDFVVPSPASDPYHGAYEIPTIPSLALDAISRIVRDSAGPATLETAAAKPHETKGYFFNSVIGEQEVIRQKANVTVKLKEEDGYYSSVLGNVYSELSSGPGRIVIPNQKEAFGARESEKIIAYREYGGVEDRLSLLDDNDMPVHPRMLLRQFVPIRAYRWLPGPERRSWKSGCMKPPTFSPRPVNLTVAQLIEINGINPLATD